MKYINNLCVKVRGFFINTRPKTKDSLDYAIEAVTRLNTPLKSQIDDYLSYIIPGDANDCMVATLRSRLPLLLEEMNLVGKRIKHGDDNAIIISAMKTLQSKHEPIKSALLHSLAVLIAYMASQDDDYSWSEIASVMEDYYQEIKLKA